MNSLQPSPWMLVAQNPPLAGQTFVIQPGFNTLGRDAACDIHLPDDSISRNHARIVAQPEGTWMEDLGSTNGTFVNGQLSSSMPRSYRRADRLLAPTLSIDHEAGASNE